MLHAAGVLTLDLASEVLDSGLGLKDATPQNVLFRGHAPVFVDVLSFERRNPLHRAWLPYAQFVRTFLLPLAANRYFGLTLADMLLMRRDGLEPIELYRMCGPVRRMLPPFLSLATLPTWLSRGGGKEAESGGGDARSAEEARFILKNLLASLRRTIDRLSPREGRDSTWANYLDAKSLYSHDQLAAKEQFVREAAEGIRPEAVLDVGSNEGFFSAICARSGARVVAIDSDPVVAGVLWRKARAEKLNILPLVVDLAHPSPGTGWRNRECASFLDRARGGFDMVLMLAVLHHLLVTEGIPLADILELAAELTGKYLVIEYVGPLDPMFRRIARGRGPLHAGFTKEAFDTALRHRFDVLRSLPIGGLDRCLYLARKKA
jgi:SAM-dependent methyltransferase